VAGQANRADLSIKATGHGHGVDMDCVALDQMPWTVIVTADPRSWAPAAPDGLMTVGIGETL